MEEKKLSLQIQNFEGPLDLLLSLVKDKKMNLMEIDLSELASQYLKLINVLKNENIDLAGEYLVMAATLLQLKARMILDNPNDETIEEDKSDILKQLVEYQQFRKISSTLRENEANRKKLFIKKSEDYSSWTPPIDETKLDGKSDAIKLIIAMRKMFERNAANRMRNASVKKFNMTAAERRVELIKIFKKNPSPSFEQIFDVPSMNHFVLTITTLLDMSRKFEIVMAQNEQYGDIIFSRGEAWSE